MEKTIKNAMKIGGVDKLFKNEYVTVVISLIGVLYACNVAPRLPSFVKNLFDLPHFRILVLFLIAYSANRNPGVALIISTCFMVSMMMLNRQDSEENFIDYLDDITNK